MNYVSTRRPDHRVTLSQAIVNGIAPDGGLYVPERLPPLTPADFDPGGNLPELSTRLLVPFTGKDPLCAELAEICREALTFETPLVPLRGAPGPAYALELFHGPTCAFKDVGARFLAAAMRRLAGARPGRLTIVVATSGDTGSAVASAFHHVDPFDVVLLYPRGMVSARQAQQLACWGGNVRTFRVRGTFDDCQRLAKEIFRDPALARTHRFSSANSINIGRLLPQMVYYAAASLRLFRETGRQASFIIPSGNFGNALACVWAREAGLPIGDIVMATNRNSPLPDYLDGCGWHPRQVVPTVASAMDVGDPSNMERLRSTCPDVDQLRRHVRAVAVTEQQIRETIRADAETLGRVWCPHSATAAFVYRELWKEDPHRSWVIVATAHPAKFNDIVEPLAGPVPIPPALEVVLQRPRQETDLEPSIEDIRKHLQD